MIKRILFCKTLKSIIISIIFLSVMINININARDNESLNSKNEIFENKEDSYFSLNFYLIDKLKNMLISDQQNNFDSFVVSKYFDHEDNLDFLPPSKLPSIIVQKPYQVQPPNEFTTSIPKTNPIINFFDYSKYKNEDVEQHDEITEVDNHETQSIFSLMESKLVSFNSSDNIAEMTIRSVSKLSPEEDSEEKFEIYMRRKGATSINKIKYLNKGKLCFLELANSYIDKCFSGIGKLNVVVISSRDQLRKNFSSFLSLSYSIAGILIVEDIYNYTNIYQDFDNAYFSITRENYDRIKLNYNSEEFEAEIIFNGKSTQYSGKTHILVGMFINLFVVVVATGVFVWHTYFHSKNYFTQLQRYYSPLPFLLIAITSGLIYKCYDSVYDEDKSEVTSIMFVLLSEILIKLFLIIYKTFFWILLILISYVNF